MTREFLGGGKMIRYRKGEPLGPQNTTISAIVAVGALPLGSRRFQVARRLRQLSDDETSTMLQDRVLRVRVYENPNAAKPLSHIFGRGSWDERFGTQDDYLRRLYVGPDLLSLEQDETAVGIHVDPWIST